MSSSASVSIVLPASARELLPPTVSEAAGSAGMLFFVMVGSRSVTNPSKLAPCRRAHRHRRAIGSHRGDPASAEHTHVAVLGRRRRFERWLPPAIHEALVIVWSTTDDLAGLQLPRTMDPAARLTIAESQTWPLVPARRLLLMLASAFLDEPVSLRLRTRRATLPSRLLLRQTRSARYPGAVLPRKRRLRVARSALCAAAGGAPARRARRPLR